MEAQSRGQNRQEPEETHHLLPRERRRNGIIAIPDRRVRNQYLRAFAPDLVAALRPNTSGYSASGLNKQQSKQDKALFSTRPQFKSPNLP